MKASIRLALVLAESGFDLKSWFAQGKKAQVVPLASKMHIPRKAHLKEYSMFSAA